MHGELGRIGTRLLGGSDVTDICWLESLSSGTESWPAAVASVVTPVPPLGCLGCLGCEAYSDLGKQGINGPGEGKGRCAGGATHGRERDLGLR